MTAPNMTPDEVLAVLDRNAKDADAARFRIKGHEAWERTKRCRVESAEARAAVAALIARVEELEPAMDICRKLAALRDGLDNSNSSAEEMASRLAHKAQALVARAEAGSHG